MNINLVLLKNKAADLFARAESERERHKARIENIKSDEGRTPGWIDGQVRHEQKKAKEIAAQYQADLKTVETSIATVKNTWSTEMLMRRAKLTPDDADGNALILGELRMMRMTAEIKDATPSELIDKMTSASQSGGLFELDLIRKEVGRREIPDAVVRMKVRTSLDDAIAGIVVPGQAEAHAAIEQTNLILEAAQDVLIELETGKESLRAHARRVGAEYAAREQAKTETA